MTSPQTVVLPGQVLYCEHCGQKHVIEAEDAPRIKVTRFGDIWLLKDPDWGVGLACDDCGQRGFLTYPPDRRCV